MEGGQQ
jgi:hypothetical protein